MQRLANLGLIHAGHWTLEQNVLRFSLWNNAKIIKVLYVFSSDGSVKYIGKSRNDLFTRMYQYQHPQATQSTNIRVNGLIRTHLEDHSSLDIHVLVDNGQVLYNNYSISLADGLENPLIELTDPDWNEL
jgi:hypothetical protein